jgi:hypothetical protein
MKNKITVRRIPPVLTANVVTAFNVISRLAYMAYAAVIYPVAFGRIAKIGNIPDLFQKIRIAFVTTIFPWVILWCSTYLTVLILNALATRRRLNFTIETEDTEQ